MSGVFDLANVFELVDDGFDNPSFSEKISLAGVDQGFFHVFANRGDKFYVDFLELFRIFFADIAFVSEGFSE